LLFVAYTAPLLSTSTHHPFLALLLAQSLLLPTTTTTATFHNTEARKREVEAAAGPALAADSAASAVDSIRALVERKNAGLISEEEFQAAKAQTLEMVRLQQLAGMQSTNIYYTVHTIIFYEFYCTVSLLVHHKIIVSYIV
jgi:hypothetical protein